MWDGIYCSGITNPVAVAEAYKRRNPFDPKKVFRLDRRWSQSVKYQTCIITPFAGKNFCFEKYLKGIDTLPLDNLCAVIYDNSNLLNFRQKIIKELRKRFKSYLLIVDENMKYTIENTNDYFLIDDKMYEIYGQIMKFIPSCRNVFIIEDDIEIPKGTYDKMLGVLNLYPEVATVVGCVMNRRFDNVPDYKWPILWDIVEHRHIETGKKEVEMYMHKETKNFGVVPIGSAHTGCWMTRKDVLDKIGFERISEIRFFDQSWGYKLYKKGYKMVVDYSVKCKHYAKVNGKLVYV